MKTSQEEEEDLLQWIKKQQSRGVPLNGREWVKCI